jgi:tRNA pseudouridine55 synthase
MNYSANDFINGQILCVDKELHWTSFQAVNAVKWALKKTYGFKKIKVGHAGTLDPLATGLLLICTGKFTKRISELQGQEKIYTGTITLGNTTPSFDLETEFDETYNTSHIDESLLNKTTEQFLGEIEQKPPVFSALKKDGKRLYEHARAGEAVEIKARKVHVAQFELTKIDLPNVDFKICCSKGTYIRSIAHDFGKALQSGAHLSALRREGIGSYRVENAMSVQEFKDAIGFKESQAPQGSSEKGEV